MKNFDWLSSVDVKLLEGDQAQIAKDNGIMVLINLLNQFRGTMVYIGFNNNLRKALREYVSNNPMPANQLARELGVSYVFINQLRSEFRNMNKTPEPNLFEDSP